MKSLSEKPSSIGSFQSYIDLVYGEVNQAKSIDYVFSYLFRSSAYLSRVVGEKGEPKTNFIKTFSWLFALSAKLGVNLEDAFVKKYPDICPYCLTNPCICLKTGKKPVDYIPEWKASEEIKFKYTMTRRVSPNLALDSAVSKINDLYPGNKHIWNAAGPTFQFFRLLEELGEVHEAYSGFVKGQRRLENVAEELADVFAWLVSTWGIVYPKMSLADEFIGYYYDGCPVCLSENCHCSDHADRGERLVELEKLMEFRGKIEELMSLEPIYRKSLESVVGSLDIVAESKSTTSAVRTVNQAKGILSEIANGVDSADKTARSTVSLINSILKMADKFGWM